MTAFMITMTAIGLMWVLIPTKSKEVYISTATSDGSEQLKAQSVAILELREERDNLKKERDDLIETVEKLQQMELPEPKVVENTVEKIVEKIVYKNISGEEINETTMNLLDECITGYFFRPKEIGSEKAADEFQLIMSRVKEFKERIPNK